MSEKQIGKPSVVVEGLKGFPDCAVCQCYPECRKDCPDHLQCLNRLPEYQRRNDENATK